MDPQVASEALDHVCVQQVLLTRRQVRVGGWPVLKTDLAKLRSSSLPIARRAEFEIP